MYSKTIVLLSGWAGSGKDSAATLLIEEMSFQRLAFADLLKEDVSAKSGIPLDFFHDSQEKDKIVPGLDVTPRQLLLAHAHVMRSLDPDIYSRELVDIISDSHHNRFVVSDWRYKSEYEAIRAQGVTVVRGRIQRPGLTVSDDSSEHDLDDESFDFTIVNDGCVSDLRNALKAAVRPYFTSTLFHEGS